MHWDIKSSLISPSLQSVNPNGAREISCCTPIFDGFQSGHLGDAQVRSWTQRRPLLSSAPGEWWSNRRHKWHFSESQQTNATADKHFSGLVLGLAKPWFFWSVCDSWDALGRWDYTQHVVDVRGCDLIKKNITHIKRSVNTIKHIMASRKNTLTQVAYSTYKIVKSYLSFFI